jgi:acyl carrier protein
MPIIQTDTFSKFRDILEASLRIPSDRITPESHIMDDLGAESLHLIEITMEVESAFNICIPEKSIIDTATEVFGAGKLVSNGQLTSAGKDLLRARMGDTDAAILDGEVKLADLRSLMMTVGSWTRMIEHLVPYTPMSCQDCEGRMEPDLGSRMKCTVCGRSVAIPQGEDINRAWVEDYYNNVYLASSQSGSERPAAFAAVAGCSPRTTGAYETAEAAD